MMSDHRKVLVANRAPTRGGSAPKNLANDRLKRLRNKLTTEVVQQPRQTQARPMNRKRQFEDNAQVHPPNKSARQANINNNRLSTSAINDNMDWCPITASETNQSTERVYIVIDTNIFISNLDLLKTISEVDLKTRQEPILYVPWMVSEELDYLKSSQRCKKEAQEAIKFLECELSRNSGRFIGQSLDEYNRQNTSGMIQDNKIIACCLQLQSQRKNIILLTNDINMKNKAHLNRITVCSHSEILAKIRSDETKVLKSGLVLQKMVMVSNEVIADCCSRAYGEKVFRHMKSFQTPPQSLEGCIKIFQKYWFSVFEDFLMKQFRKIIEELATFLSKKINLEEDNNLKQLIHMCKKMCIYMKDVENCKNELERVIADLNNMRDSL